MSFVADRRLLNPKFEGYKLAQVDDADVNVVANHPLQPPGISQSTVPSNSQLVFAEVQSRIKQNHLAVVDENELAYIDSSGGVILITVNATTLEPTFTTIWTLPQNVQSPATQNIAPEYPLLHAISANLFIISDGASSFYLIHRSQGLLGVYQVSDPQYQLPTRLHTFKVLDDQNIIILITTRTPGLAPKTKVTFDLLALHLTIPTTPSQDIQSLPILWKKRSSDLPSLVTIQDDYVLLASSLLFRDPDDAIVPNYTPSKSEIAPIPRENENLDVEMAENLGEPAPPPYSWTQSSDQLTIAFPLPSDLPKSHIHVSFGPKYLTLLIRNESDLESPIPLPKYAMRELWDFIDPSCSVWTWDREGERSSNHPKSKVGLLTLHLEKRQENLKWLHLFAHHDSEPPETLDPSELASIRDQLEKFTSTLQSGEDPSASLGLGSGLPSLAQGEIDESVDKEVGRRTIWSWFGIKTGNEVTGPGYGEVEVLSTPLPFASSQLHFSIITKQAIDGLQFTPPTIPSLSSWTHSATFSALSFVLASKRDTKYVYHLDKKAVLAFESGNRMARANLYVYYNAGGGKNAAQKVLRIGSDAEGGSILGAAGLHINGHYIVVCLREKELTIVKRLF